MSMISKAEAPARVAGLEPDPYRVAPQPSPVALGSALDRIEEVLRAEEKRWHRPARSTSRTSTGARTTRSSNSRASRGRCRARASHPRC
jgi:hypothetical protein